MLDPKKQQNLEQAVAGVTEFLSMSLGSMREAYLKAGFDKNETFILCQHFLQQYLNMVLSSHGGWNESHEEYE